MPTPRARQVARALAAWSVAYAGYRAYYALGGEFRMIGVPRSEAQYQVLNGVGAGVILLSAALAVLSVRVRRLTQALPVLGWLGAVGCCMHGLVDMTLRILSLSGVHPTELPDFWLSYDRHRSDLQDLFFNEPWFLVTGLLWGALGLTCVRAARRRAWIWSAVAACLTLTVVGVLSGLDVIGSFVVG